MFKYLLILAVAYFFFRWQEKTRQSEIDGDNKQHIKDNRSKNSSVSDHEGDYIDYEEVD